MSNTRERHIETQLLVAQSVPLEPDQFARIKIKGQSGETVWINVNADTLRKIELALFEQATGE